MKKEEMEEDENCQMKERVLIRWDLVKQHEEEHGDQHGEANSTEWLNLQALPPTYSHKLKAEAAMLLQEIKQGLANCITCLDPKMCSHWSRQLNK